MEQLKGDDALFIAMERPSSPTHVATVTIYDPSTAPGGFVRFKDILAFTESRLHLAKTMRQKIVKVPFNIDMPYWVEDDEFDLEFHVRHLSLPQPGDWRQLCILVARLFARPLDLSRPPWEMTVIEGLDKIKGYPKGCYAVITKVHHSAVDGAAGVELMQALHTITPDEALPDVPNNWKPERRPSDARLFMKGYGNLWLRPFRSANAMRKAIPGIIKVATDRSGKADVRPQDKRTPKTRFNGVISPHRVFDARYFDITKIKAMRSFSEGSKINDVMISLVSGAMRHYLAEHDELPTSSLKTIIPINLRTEAEKSQTGNQVSAMMTSLGSDISDPQERVRFIHSQTASAKDQTAKLGPREVTGVMQQIPFNVMNVGANIHRNLKLANHTKKTINTIVTNVPGPPIPIYSAGAKAVAMFGQICLVDGVGIGHVVVSYLDKISISFTACRDAMPDPLFYAECLEKSYADHLKALKEFEAEAKKAPSKKIAAKKPSKPAKPNKPSKPSKPTTA
ncbi:MAG: WS/DGAT/MGAT family O-acyltransferase [Maricaulaceae bacterium]